MSNVLWYPGQEILVPDVVAATGWEVVDRGGRRYVDLESGVWCTSIGHSHPRVAAVIAERARSFGHAGFNYGSAIVEDAACDVLAVAGLGEGSCAFLCSGSEAVEYMVRAAQSRLPGRRIMTLADSYFGAYGTAARRDPAEWYVFDWSSCARCPEGCTPECPRWREIPFEELGGFLFEPGSSSGLVRFPPRALVRGIAERVAAAGGFLLVNEVTTGVGRTGRWFGHQHDDLTPDAIAIGKGIGNGYPVSVAAFGSSLSEWLRKSPLRYAQSHQNDPLGASVVREVVRVISEGDLIERGRRAGEHLMTSLRTLAARRATIGDVRGRGLMIAIELADDTRLERARTVHRDLADRGWLVGCRTTAPVLRLDPCLTVPIDVLDGFVAALDAALERIT